MIKLNYSFVAFLMLSCATFAWAGDAAVTDLDKVDAAYQYLGEYLGDWQGEPVGVQVSSHKGDIPFYAKLFPGGLPGAGWNGTQPRLFQGSLAGSQLRLMEAGGSAQLDVNSAAVTLADADSRAEFHKVLRRSVTLGLAPPPGATVLFDGADVSRFKGAKITADGLLAAGAETNDPIGSCRIHLEFRTPYMPTSEDQKRGNSGVYIQRRYEVQILESFGQDCVFNGCGALYRQRKPNFNMSLPPLVWQTYDIFFRAARFNDAGDRVTPAQISVIHNGVPVHYQTAIAAKTGAGKPEGPEPLPLLLQDHSDPIVYRNVWLLPIADGSLSQVNKSNGP